LDYIVFLERCDQLEALSGNAYKLYLKLLSIANVVGWPAEFAKSDSYVAAVCGFSENTMKDCRTKLVAAGLLATIPGKMGRGATTVYQLLGQAKVKNKVSEFDTLAPNKPSEFDTLPDGKPSNSDTLNTEKGPNKVSNFDTPYIDKNREEGSSVADAAAPTPSISEKPEAKPKRGAGKPKGATHEEIAALPLPYPGAEFAETWKTFYTTNTKQVGKNISAFELMLKRMGRKYPEAFAVLMLEKAIMGNWQGAENGGTARDFQDWQAEQARNPAPAAPTIVPSITPEINEEFLAQQQAREDAEQAAHFAKYATA
jgi:hypothetical protein